MVLHSKDKKNGNEVEEVVSLYDSMSVRDNGDQGPSLFLFPKELCCGLSSDEGLCNNLWRVLSECVWLC